VVDVADDRQVLVRFVCHGITRLSPVVVCARE